MTAGAKYGGEELHLFETGYIVIGNKRLDVEEISVNVSRDYTPYHVAAQRDPIDQRPGKNKIEFSFKRAFSDTFLSQLYDNMCKFTMILMNNDPVGFDGSGTAQKIMVLRGCRISQDNMGPINGGDIVSQDISGVAIERITDFDKISEAIQACTKIGAIREDSGNSDKSEKYYWKDV